MKSRILSIADGLWVFAAITTLASMSVPIWVMFCVLGFVYFTTLRPVLRVLSHRR